MASDEAATEYAGQVMTECEPNICTRQRQDVVALYKCPVLLPLLAIGIAQFQRP